MGRITWVPGHMARALRDVQRLLKQAVLVLEVRDARVSCVLCAVLCCCV